MLTEYEIVFIVRPDVDDAVVDDVIGRVETAIAEIGGTRFERDDWGKRKLAYLIDKHARGHYVLVRAGLPTTSVSELERRLRYDERVLRFLTSAFEPVADLDARVQVATEKQKELDELAKRRRELGDAAFEDLDRMGDDEDDDVQIDVAALD